MTNTTDTPVAVLVIEDNPLDAEMIRRALRSDRNWDTQVEVTNDGEKAVHYLMQQEPFADASRPDLLILDLNLPKRNGTEVLRIIRTSELLSDLPVVILSSSPEDVIRELVARSKFRADLYLTKPTNIKDYLALGKLFRECYDEVCRERSGEAES